LVASPIEVVEHDRDVLGSHRRTHSLTRSGNWSASDGVQTP
jgi:hypothetical protein